ncbi:hypothetical protein NEOLI_004006 [Neolecta irregularis DAH-3]|uniref:Uncharacterized protein n=1 Tax=Neolecta irregularis (strain DAH-3) TaxID=1198029 RepID=A0A1U7LPC0_NEOID|nr:hypothetical protein NEOLI_004006 [Neolecta irregularis DAH-3]|eukprot:OLL24520.1 hypothetical protein NEOLI_004006 [Neolecta irregularis DAH-3]
MPPEKQAINPEILIKAKQGKTIVFLKGTENSAVADLKTQLALALSETGMNKAITPDKIRLAVLLDTPDRGRVWEQLSEQATLLEGGITDGRELSFSLQLEDGEWEDFGFEVPQDEEE